MLISRALSPAKPLDLYIDDDRSYCIAIFDDDDLELAIGRAGVNVNLAANVTNYKIDAFGKNEYERKQKEQETLLGDIENVKKSIVKILNDNEVFTVSDLLNSSEERVNDACAMGQGFIYCVSVLGVTGTRESLSKNIEEKVRTVKEKTKLPVAVGFGISKPSHVNELKKFADGAVIGSAIIDVIGESKKSDNVINVIDFISKLSK